MNKIKISLLFSLLLLNMGLSYAQDIFVRTYYTGNAVLLRWYPAKHDIYKACTKEGFIIERRQKGSAEGWKEMAVIRKGSYEEIRDLSRTEPNAEMLNIILYREKVIDEYMKAHPDSSRKVIEKHIEQVEKGHEKFVYDMMLIQTEFNTSFAKFAALNYMDEEVHTQEVYEYRIKTVDPSLKYKSEVATVETNHKNTLCNMTRIEVNQEEKNLEFRWPVTANLRADYSGYQLERSKDGKKFVRVNPEAIIPLKSKLNPKDTCSYRDTLPNCGQVYYYRVCGISRFGMRGPYSNVVTVKCSDPYMLRPIIDNVDFNTKGEAVIKWHVDNPEKQVVKSFVVQRAENVTATEEIFDNISKQLPATTLSYIDKHPLKNDFYRVVAYGEDNGQYNYSNIVYAHPNDSMPPSVPKGLKGVIDSMGVVSLTWDKNPEEDLRGYRVFFANDSTQTFLSCSDTFLKVPFYTDTLYLGSLTNDIYYKVLAVGDNYAQSELSPAIKLMKPDTIPPAKIVLDDMKQNDDGTVVLTWFDSPSKDVAQIELSRRISPDTAWVPLNVWKAKKSTETFTDTMHFSGETVYYQFKVSDESDNTSITESYSFKTKYVKRQCVKDVKTSVDYKKGSVRVSWSKCGCNVKMTRIFRKKDGEDSRLVETLLGNERIFYDTDVVKGHKYQYILLPVTEKGAIGDKSEEITF